MNTAPIEYVLTDIDRRGLSLSSGVDLKHVPTRVTGGVLDMTRTAVMFLEMVGGHRIVLSFEGRPALAQAVGPALAMPQQKVA